MSNFVCEHCGAHIVDSPAGHLSGCRHYPRETESQKAKAFMAEKICSALDKGAIVTEPETCEICKTRKPVPKYKICWVCMGFPERQDEPATPEPPETLGRCDTCGLSFEPYKLGRGIVPTGICYPCVMKKKYGPDWVPGGKRKSPEQRRAANRAYRAKCDAKKLALAGKDNGRVMQDNPDTTVKDASEEASELFDSKFPWVGQRLDQGVPCVSLCFDARDQAMYEKIADIARTERRSIEQQVLYLLDGVLSRMVV